jgi:hypothetical protein
MPGWHHSSSRASLFLDKFVRNYPNWHMQQTGAIDGRPHRLQGCRLGVVTGRCPF